MCFPEYVFVTRHPNLRYVRSGKKNVLVNLPFVQTMEDHKCSLCYFYSQI
ncbi:hypothetical protein HanXRQr2_Chr08g0346541 [Helianthus annuus]|uniref:Uncharacterized protein n=1 Tax=Helianthus annuus TaxID=4232 RepID=A0A9K3IGB3_HELAN|nr:hypothetical protein HanXRQr2_Chr08g0346541 [Helianthus annuus]